MAKLSDKVNANVQGKKGRKRRAAGWTLLALGVLVAGAWCWSICAAPRLNARALQAELLNGTFKMFYMGGVRGPAFRLSNDPMPSTGIHWTIASELEVHPRNYCGVVAWWRDTRRTRTEENWYLQVVLWPFPLFLWTPAALLLRSGILARRRANTRSCSKCRYSLAGLAAGAACPECGVCK